MWKYSHGKSLAMKKSVWALVHMRSTTTVLDIEEYLYFLTEVLDSFLKKHENENIKSR